MINGDLGFDRDGEAETHSIHCLCHIPPYPRGSEYANASYKTSMTYNLMLYRMTVYGSSPAYTSILTSTMRRWTGRRQSYYLNVTLV